MGLRFTGTGGVTVTVPSVEKLYFIVNDSSAAVTISAGGTTTAVAAGAYSWVATDGTNTYRDGPTLDKIPAAVGDVAFGSNKITGVAAGTANTDGINLQQLNTAIAAATTATTPGTVLVSSQDTTARYLGNAIAVSGDITATVTNPGGDETLTLTVTVPPVDVAGGATETSTGSTVTITSASTRVQAITPSANLQVTLPDATTLDEGTPVFVIHHTGSANTITVRDNGGGLIASLTTGEILTCALEDNSAPAGTWARFKGTNPSGSSLQATDVFEGASSSNISATQLTTDKILFGYTDGGNSSRPTAVVIDYSGASPSIGTAAEIATGSSATGISVAGITATTAICTYANGTTSGVAVVLSVSGVAITVETADGDTFEAAECRFISVDVCSSSLAIVSYRDVGNTDFPTACSITIANGTELTAGTPVQISAAGCSFTKIKAINATQAMVFWRQTNSGRVVVVTESSGLSVGTFQEVSTNAVFADIAILSSTRAFAYYDESNTATIKAIAISGAALTVGNSTGIQTPSSGGTTGHGLIALDDETAFAHHSDDNAGVVYVQNISWNSGTPLASLQTTVAIDGGNFTSALVDTKKYAIGYDDDGNSSYGTSSLIEEFV
jgi:hypothetical protein